MTLEFWFLYIPVVLSLLVLFWAVTRQGDRIADIENLLDRDEWDGQMQWPVEDAERHEEAIRGLATMRTRGIQ